MDIRSGDLCNCNGEGRDVLLVRTVDNEKKRVSVAFYHSDKITSLKEARYLWQFGFFCWESMDKIHFDYLTQKERDFNLVDKYGSKLEKAEKVKTKQIKCPDNIEDTLCKYYVISYEKYLDGRYGYYLGAYLAEKLLNADRDLAFAIGKILVYIYEVNLDCVLSGHESSIDENVVSLIRSMSISNDVSEHFANTLKEWSDANYYQNIKKAFT